MIIYKRLSQIKGKTKKFDNILEIIYRYIYSINNRDLNVYASIILPKML